MSVYVVLNPDKMQFIIVIFYITSHLLLFNLKVNFCNKLISVVSYIFIYYNKSCFITNDYLNQFSNHIIISP